MKKGEEYSRSALLGFRNSIERYLNNNGCIVKISRNQVFQKSKKILDAKLWINRRAGKENIQHKPVIVPSDLAKIRASPFLSVTNPGRLLRRMWLYVSLYWCRRGREGQRDLRRDSSKFTKDANGREYAVMTHEEATLKPSWWWNQQALSWTSNKALQHWSRRWCICQSQIVRVQVESLLPSILSKTKSQIHHRRHRVVWKQLLGVNKLGDMMKIISKGANLSQVYTNHSVRSSAITVLSDANVPDRHIMFVSGHSGEQSILHYIARPSAPQLESVSDTVSNALQYNQTQSTQISTVSSTPSATPLIESSNRMASSVSMSSASASFPSGFFNNCNIQGGVQCSTGFRATLMSKTD